MGWVTVGVYVKGGTPATSENKRRRRILAHVLTHLVRYGLI